MCFIDIKNSYRLFKIRSVDQNQLFIAVSPGKCIVESSWVPNKSSETNINVFKLFSFFVSRNVEYSTLQKIACGFLAPEEQEKVITGPYSLASFVCCAKIFRPDHVAWASNTVSAYGFCVFSVTQAQLFLENIPLCKGNRGTKAAEHENAEANGREEHTVNIFGARRSEKGKRGGKKNQGLCMPVEKGLQTWLCLQGCLVQPCSLLGRCRRRLSVHQCYSSLLVFQWPSTWWGGAPCSRGCELLCCLRACLLPSSFLILLGRDILLGQRSSAGLWLSRWC